jgi:stage V sporulation protein AC
MTNRDYDQFVKKASPNSKSYLNIPKAFVVGGAICTLGQLLLNLYQYLGAPEDLAPTAVSVSLVFLSALHTGLNVYDNIAKHGGAGTLVPITGFANAVASPALEFKNEGLILGVGAKMFVIAGPVIVYGVSSSVIYGLIINLFGL